MAMVFSHQPMCATELDVDAPCGGEIATASASSQMAAGPAASVALEDTSCSLDSCSQHGFRPAYSSPVKRRRFRDKQDLLPQFERLQGSKCKYAMWEKDPRLCLILTLHQFGQPRSSCKLVAYK
jgi:hypothetical protein